MLWHHAEVLCHDAIYTQVPVWSLPSALPQQGQYACSYATHATAPYHGRVDIYVPMRAIMLCHKRGHTRSHVSQVAMLCQGSVVTGIHTWAMSVNCVAVDGNGCSQGNFATLMCHSATTQLTYKHTCHATTTWCMAWLMCEQRCLHHHDTESLCSSCMNMCAHASMLYLHSVASCRKDLSCMLWM